MIKLTHNKPGMMRNPSVYMESKNRLLDPIDK